MTTPRKTQTRATKPAAPRTKATPAQVAAALPAAPAQPTAFVVPAQLHVDALKLIGSLPIMNEQAKQVFEQMRRVPTLESVLATATIEEPGGAAAD